MRDSGDNNSTPKFTHRFSVVFSFDADTDNVEDMTDEFLIEKSKDAIQTGRFAGFDWNSTTQNRK